MSKFVGDRLPQELRTAFDGEDLESKIGLAYILLTADADGAPRPCMLSVGEILAVNDRLLRVALWASSTTATNLAQGRPTTLIFVAPATVLYIKGRGRALSDSPATRLARREIVVHAVEIDMHEGMPIVGPLAFSVNTSRLGGIVDTWRRQIESLRES